MFGKIKKMVLIAGMTGMVGMATMLPLSCSTGVSTGGRSNLAADSSAPQQDDAQVDRQSAGTNPNILAGVNLVTFANAAPDCEDNFTGKSLTGFSCFSAAKIGNALKRSKNLESNLVLQWELPTNLAGVSSCPPSIDKATEIHCTYTSTPAAAFKINLRVTKDSQQRDIPSQPIAQSSGAGGGSSGGTSGGSGSGDISAATSLVLYLAGPVRGDAGIAGFDSVCQTAIDNNPSNIAALGIHSGRVLLREWDMMFSLPRAPAIFTPYPGNLVPSQLVRKPVASDLYTFADETHRLSDQVNLTLDGSGSLLGNYVWTGMGSRPMFGQDCGAWSNEAATGTVGLVGAKDSGRLFTANQTCSYQRYIYCLGW